MDNKLIMMEAIFELMSLMGKGLYDSIALSNKMKLTTTQLDIIFILHKKQITTSSEISKILKINKSNLSSQIETLFELGLIEREQNSKDRRKVFLTLSKKGWDKMRDFMIASTEVAFERMPDITQDEINEIIDSITDIKNILRKRLLNMEISTRTGHSTKNLSK